MIDSAFFSTAGVQNVLLIVRTVMLRSKVLG